VRRSRAASLWSSCRLINVSLGEANVVPGLRAIAHRHQDVDGLLDWVGHVSEGSAMLSASS